MQKTHLIHPTKNNFNFVPKAIKWLSMITKILVTIIRLYRYCLSPWLGHCCRFMPSCSQYAELALKQHGVCFGAYLTLRRLLKCHPWHEGGVDAVPEKTSK